MTDNTQLTNRLFWFISVPIVLVWIASASLMIWQSVVNGVTIVENQTMVLAIIGGPALLIITNILDLYKQETTTDIQNMTPNYDLQSELAKIQLAHDLERKKAQHEHEMLMERTQRHTDISEEEQ